LFAAQKLTELELLQREQPHWNTCVQNWLSTNRPSFAVASQVVTLARLTNERVVYKLSGWVDLLQAI